MGDSRIHSACVRSTTRWHATRSSLETPDYQLEVAVEGKTGVASRFVADDSLSRFQVQCMGLAIPLINPVPSSLHHNCTVLGVELQTN